MLALFQTGSPVFASCCKGVGVAKTLDPAGVAGSQKSSHGAARSLGCMVLLG